MATPNNALVVQNQNTQLAPPGEMTREQVELLKRTICQGASDDELKLFLEVCKRRRLDPFSKQIYAVKRWNSDVGQNVTAHQVSIDGFRAIADRTGLYDGQDAPEWCGEDGVWCSIWPSSKPPFAARAKIYKKGVPRPFIGIAEWRQCVQTKKGGEPTRMWMPGGSGPYMLSKCAEAAAFRKGFPEDCGGLYAPEEVNNIMEAEVVDDGRSAGTARPTSIAQLKARLAPVASPTVNAESVSPQPGPLSGASRASTPPTAAGSASSTRPSGKPQAAPEPVFDDPFDPDMNVQPEQASVASEPQGAGADLLPVDVDPNEPSRFDFRLRFEMLPGQWDEWCNSTPWNSAPGKKASMLQGVTPAMAIGGSLNGKRHLGLLRVIEWAEKKSFSPNDLPMPVIQADYCLAILEERWNVPTKVHDQQDPAQG